MKKAVRWFFVLYLSSAILTGLIVGVYASTRHPMCRNSIGHVLKGNIPVGDAMWRCNMTSSSNLWWIRGLGKLGFKTSPPPY
jgi:hypothetical protein